MRMRVDVLARRARRAAGRAVAIAGNLDRAFRHFERAHVIGQRNTWAHARAHPAMSAIGWRGRDPGKVFGQVLRSPAAPARTGPWVPAGGTGRADVGAFRSLPLPAHLARNLDSETAPTC